MRTAMCLAFGLWACAPAEATNGPAIAIDGDTIRIAKTSIRLSGIDAPEVGQLCGELRCGEISRYALASLLSGAGEVQCRSRGQDKYGRVLAFCKIVSTGTDLGWWLVSRGHAVATDSVYADVEAAAKAKGVGVWSRPFTRPCLYRNPEHRSCR